ncbi:MAG: division/cell wall cluster transcriptional repressor MraZ [Clostridiaceae bacterium]|nr:division/cell wall cluster transcriptional repressor MraZ [Clostridiaceae bacterium]
MPGFNGEFSHTMDAKGRVIIPAKYREGLGEEFILTKGLDRCLVLYTMEHWAELEKKLSQLSIADYNSRFYRRFFSAGATNCELDKQGRILIPQNLREYAGLDKDVTIIGAINTVEIWDTAAYNEFMQKNLGNMDKIAIQMAEMGF